MPPTYGRIAPLYRTLEYIAFGRALQQARSEFVDQLRLSKQVIVFGPGDGRCFENLLPAAPEAEFISIDSDPRMTSLARRQVDRLGATQRIHFICDDVRNVSLPETYDAVVTHFFLDCFDAPELDALIPRIGAGLVETGAWLFADFAIPFTPFLARWRAQIWVRGLCLFFRSQAGHTLSTLPPMEPLLLKHGFGCVAARDRQAGLIRSAVYRRKKQVV